MPMPRPCLVFRHSSGFIGLVSLLLLVSSTLLAVSTPAQTNPVPFVSIPLPVSINPGSTGVTFIVRGSGFVPASVVHWNGTPLATLFVSTQILSANIPDVLVAAAGLGRVTVVSPAPGGGTSNVLFVPVMRTLAASSFPAAPTSLPPVGNTPKGLVTGDFNGDGNADLAVANNLDNTVSILLGHGDGTFTPALPVAVGFSPLGLAAGDFNGDGKLDLIAVNSVASTISILLGQGDGTFTLASSPAVGSLPVAVATADLDRNGTLDLVVTNFGDNTVSILLGNGDGTFAAGAIPSVGVGPQIPVIGDFNEDGILDIAVTNGSASSVSMLLGIGDGTFQAQLETAVGASGTPLGLIAADFDQNTHLDLAAVDLSDLAIFLQTGNGVLGTAIHGAPVTGGLVFGTTGDFDGDTNLDIVVANQSANSAFLFPGDIFGTFTPAFLTITPGGGTYGVVSADFNGDGALDLAFTRVGANNVAILLQILPVSLTPASLAFGNQVVPTSSSPRDVTLTNNSGTAVTVSSITIAGPDAGEFFQTNNCGTVAIAATCTISVTFAPSTLGAKLATLTVTDSDATSPQTLALSGTGVLPTQVITKAFGASSVPLNGSTSLTFTLTNPNGASSFTNISFTDALPAGLVVATPPALTNSCGGTATAVAGASSVGLTGVALAPSASCTVAVNVTGTTAGTKNNSVTSTSAESGMGNTASASLTVVDAAGLVKSFGAPSIPLGGSTSLSFTVTNANAGSTLTSVAFSDTLPAGLVIATPNGLTGSCGGGTITAVQGTGVVSLSGATLAPSAACTFSVNITGTAPGDKANATSTVTSAEGPAGGAASANITVVAPPSLAKAFGAGTIAVNGVTSLTITVTNPALNTVAQAGVAFTDSLPAGIVVATPNALVNTCGGTATGVAGSSSITLAGAAIATPGASCTVTANVMGTTVGTHTNTTGAVTSTNGGTGNTATAALMVGSVPTITKAFGAPTIPLNGSTSLTFTITNPNATLALTGVTFSDTLPAGLVVSTPNGLTGTCGAGTITAAAGSGAISLAGGTLAATQSCTFSVNVTGTTAGAKANTTSAVASTESGAGATSNTATLTVLLAPTIAKAFGAASVALGSGTTLTFTITNSNTAAGLTGVAVGDTLPAGLVVSTPAGLTGTCGAGTITATAGASAITLAGGTIAASGTCTFAVNVTAIVGGSQVNTTAAVTSTNGGTGNTATATLTVLAPDLTIAKSHIGNFHQGQTGGIYTITVSNVGNAPTSGTASVADALPTGLTATAFSGTGWSCTLSPLVCTRADSLAIGGSYPPLTLTVNVSGTAPASVTNSASVSGAGQVNTSNDTASDVTTIDVVPQDFSIAAAPVAITLKAGQQADYTLTLTPLNNVPFSTAITLTAAGLPANTTLVFQPPTVTPGTSAATGAFLVMTSANDPFLARNVDRRSVPLFAVGMPLAGILLFGAGFRRKKWLHGKSRLRMVVLFVLMGSALYGCAGTSFRNLGTPPGSYTVTVTGTGGSVQHTTTVTLAVQP